ncbi:hypothetical protein ACEN9H_32075 (plasmid) [Massilia cellulosiltytica]|uniref:hypothetical protein n=1 Tax=Massilia cellulosiltytica TaxID=2683234 RepID=UPI0039B6447B
MQIVILEPLYLLENPMSGAETEVVRVGIHDARSRDLLAGPIFLHPFPRQGEILVVDGQYYQVLLTERDYKTQDEAKAYVKSLGRHDDYVVAFQSIISGATKR